MTEYPNTAKQYSDYSDLHPSDPDELGLPLEVAPAPGAAPGGGVAGQSIGTGTGGGAPGYPAQQYTDTFGERASADTPPPGPAEFSEQDLDVLPAPSENVSTEPGLDLAEQFRRDFGTQVTPTTTIAVPARDGWELRFRLDWPETKSREWRKRANDPSSPEGVSLLRLYRAAIADQCTAILFRGTPLTQGGRVLTFRDPMLWPLLAKPGQQPPRGAEAAVHALIPVFAQLVTVGQRMTRAAGSDDLLDPLGV